MKQHTILLIQSCMTERIYYRQMLQDADASNGVLEATSGQEGWVCCKTHAIDAVIVNAELEDMNGLDFLQQMRDHTQAHKPAILMIGKDCAAIAVEAMQRGAQDYLVDTNITGEKLRIAVNNAIANARGDTSAIDRDTVLKTQQSLVEQVANAVPGVLYVHDLVTRANIYLNREVGTALGYSPEEVHDMGSEVLHRLMHPEDLPKILHHFETLSTAPEQHVFELSYRMRHRHGEWRWFHSREVVFKRDAQGTPLELLGTAQDVTEQLRTQLELQRANDRYELATSVTDSLIYDWDLQTGEIQRSTGLLRVVGFAPDEVPPIAAWWSDRIHPEDAPSVFERFNACLATEPQYTAEYRVRHRDNSYRWVEVNGAIVRDATGTAIRMVGSTTNITDRKQFEEERSRLLELEQVARQKAEVASRSKDEFLALVSHELRSPLNSILGWVKLLQAGRLDDKTTLRALATIERNTQTQARLVEDLLDMSRLLQGQFRVVKNRVDLMTLIETTVETLMPMVNAKSLRLEIECKGMSIEVLGDPSRLQQVFLNLLTNAVKFTPEGGRIAVRFQVDQNQAVIHVEDTGRGISASALPHVFERFWQADHEAEQPTTKQEGLGLGLAIARRLVELHEGTIAVNSAGLHQGTTFTIRLPLLQVPPEPEALPYCHHRSV